MPCDFLVAQRPQFTVFKLEDADIVRLLSALAKAEVKVAAFFRHKDELVFAPGDVDPRNPSNEKQVRRARNILKCLHLHFCEQIVLELNPSDEDPARVDEPRLLQAGIKTKNVYIGFENTLWFEIEGGEEEIAKALKIFLRPPRERKSKKD